MNWHAVHPLTGKSIANLVRFICSYSHCLTSVCYFHSCVSAVWTAGYALGCIALGRGHSLPGIADLHLDAALWHLVEGGEDPFSAPTKTHATQLDIVAGSSVDPARAAAAVAAAVHSSLFASSAAFLSTHGAPGATAQMTATAASHAQYQHYAHALGNVSTSNISNGISSTLGGSKYAAERLSCVQEGPMVNTEMTAPGALVALGSSCDVCVVCLNNFLTLLTWTGLMYLKTNDAALMARMALPQTPDLLDANSRPDFMLLRVWSRAMIGWDSVRPSRQWIWSQVRLFVWQFSFIESIPVTPWNFHRSLALCWPPYFPAFRSNPRQASAPPRPGSHPTVTRSAWMGSIVTLVIPKMRLNRQVDRVCWMRRLPN
jgi:hypothetical protein